MTRKIVILLLLCLAFCSEAQKKYVVRIELANGTIRKGILFRVADGGIYYTPTSMALYKSKKDTYLGKTNFINVILIKNIKLRRRGSGFLGAMGGYLLGIPLGVAITKAIVPQDPNRSTLSETLGTFGVTWNAIFVTGAIIGHSYPNKINVAKDSASYQDVQLALRKYEWYPEEIKKDTLNTPQQ